MWHDDNFVYFTCTSGGKKKLGQIWKINITQQSLELIFESHNSDAMRACDNITIAPWGDVIVCEDGRGRDRIMGIKKNGETYVIAENILNRSELYQGFIASLLRSAVSISCLSLLVVTDQLNAESGITSFRAKP